MNKVFISCYVLIQMNKKVEARLNRIIGQLEGIKKVLGTDTECEKVTVQFKAAKSALDSCFCDFIQNKALHCCPKTKPDFLKKLLQMIIK